MQYMPKSWLREFKTCPKASFNISTSYFFILKLLLYYSTVTFQWYIVTCLCVKYIYSMHQSLSEYYGCNHIYQSIACYSWQNIISMHERCSIFIFLMIKLITFLVITSYWYWVWVGDITIYILHSNYKGS